MFCCKPLQQDRNIMLLNNDYKFIGAWIEGSTLAKQSDKNIWSNFNTIVLSKGNSLILAKIGLHLFFACLRFIKYILMIKDYNSGRFWIK